MLTSDGRCTAGSRTTVVGFGRSSGSSWKSSTSLSERWSSGCTRCKSDLLAALRRTPLKAEPRSTGNEKTVIRNLHHKDAVGKGDPQCFKGMAGKARFSVGDEVRVRQLPTILYSRTQEYLRGAPGTITRVSYESLAPEDEAFNREGEKPEWFYIVRFKMADLWKSYAGPPQDTLQSEIVERWLEPRSA